MDCSFLLLGSIISGLIGMAIGSVKGSPGTGFFLGFLLGPIGWLIIALVPDNRPKCPYCKGAIIPGAIKCKNCGSTIPRCPACNKIIGTETAECKHCGQPLSNRRPRGMEYADAAEQPIFPDELPGDIRFACPGCGKSIKTKARMAGRLGRCPGCGSRFEVPE